MRRPRAGRVNERSVRRLARFWPVALLACIAAATYALGLHRHVSFAALAEQQQALRAFVAAHPVLAPLAYVAVYTVAVSVAVPGGLVLSMAGGLLFGTVEGSLCAVPAITAGSILLFLAARSALRPMLERRAGRFMARLKPGLERDGFGYLLVLRLLPLMPFWIINIAPALAGMRLGPYALATVLGITPNTIVIVSLGAGLGGTLEAGVHPDLSTVLRPSVLLPLLGLATLAALPIAWRWWKTRRIGRATPGG